jgi:hypothetical protein
MRDPPDTLYPLQCNREGIPGGYPAEHGEYSVIPLSDIMDPMIAHSEYLLLSKYDPLHTQYLIR